MLGNASRLDPPDDSVPVPSAQAFTAGKQLYGGVLPVRFHAALKHVHLAGSRGVDVDTEFRAQIDQVHVGRVQLEPVRGGRHATVTRPPSNTASQGDTSSSELPA